MFGYVRPLKGELKVREYEMYQAAYCGLCAAMKRRYGGISTLLLNYDLTFLAVLLLSLSAHPGYVDKRCAASPFKRKRMCAPCAALEQCAGFAVILGCEKLRDDLRDRGFFKSFPSRLALLLLHGAEKRAGRDFPEFRRDVKNSLSRLEELERERSPVLDAAADTFATILSSAGKSVGGEAGEHLTKMLYHVGRWVYIADARDDLAKDARSGSYNAVALRFNVVNAQPSEEAEEYLLSTMDLSSDLAADEARRLELGMYRGIVDNILTKGLPFISRKILKGEWRRKSRKKI
jgi:hypothetical protein